jgi:hypothetical protein
MFKHFRRRGIVFAHLEFATNSPPNLQFFDREENFNVLVQKQTSAQVLAGQYRRRGLAGVFRFTGHGTARG